MSGPKKLPAILKEHADWRSRVGVQARLITGLDEFLEGAYLSGYMQALIDHKLPTDKLAAEIARDGLTISQCDLEDLEGR